jgi:flagellin-like hook-associated protein FlgL
MTRINTNTAALMAKAYGQKANQRMLEPMQRLSSGLRINSASDDAAGLAVGNKMLASMKSYQMGVKNSIDMIGLLTTAEGALSEITDIQMRIRELAIQSANGTYVSADRDKMQIELNNLVGEMDRIADHTKFNDITLFDGAFYGQIVQTGKDSGDHVRIDIDEVDSCELGRFWETYTFRNGDFESSGTTTKIADDVYSISGWEIHNKRIELGEAAQGDAPAADSPATIVNRDGDVVDNLIGGWAIPRDPTPRPYKNAINVLVNPSNSNTTNDSAFTYDTTYNGIVDPAPPDPADPGTFNVTIGPMETVSIVGSSTTSNADIMGATYNNVTADQAAAGGTAAQFNVTIGDMTVTPTDATKTTNNVAVMGQSYENMAGVGGSGVGAQFRVSVGEMTFTAAPASSSTSNTNMMGKTYNNVTSESNPDHGGTDARFNVTVGAMTVTQDNATKTTDTTAMLGRTFTNVAGTGGSGTGAQFNVTVGEMTFTQTPKTTNQGELYGRTYRNVSATAPGAGGQAAVFDVNIDMNGNVTATVVDEGSGYVHNEAITISSAQIGNIGDVSLTAKAANIGVSLSNVGSNYVATDVITIRGSLIGGQDGGPGVGDDILVSVNPANVTITPVDTGSGYVGYAGSITIPGELVGGANDGSDDIAVTSGDANISVTVTNKGSGYRAGDVITVPIGASGDTVQVTVNTANIGVSLVDPGTGYKVGEQIRISGTQFGGHDVNDQIVVVGNNPTVTVDATSGSGYTVGGTVTLAAGSITAGSQALPTTVVKVPPGTDDSSRPAAYGDIESDNATGFSVEDGVMKLNTGSMTSVYGWDIVHGPYIISSEAKEIEAGEKLFFDWKASGTNDAFDVFAYLLDVDTGATQVLLDQTQQNAGSTNWATVETTVAAKGNYKYVFINGTYDATGGRALGAEMYIDNIYIQREGLPAEQQHTMCDISLKNVADANNAIEVMDLAISQISTQRAKFGALVNRLRQSIEMASSSGDNLKMARSRVFDAEYSIETSRLAKQQILARASMAMLAQANKSKNSILQLLN